MMQTDDVPTVLGTPTTYSYEASEGPGFIEVCLPPNGGSVSVPTEAPIEWVSMTIKVSAKRTGLALIDQYAYTYAGSAQAARVFASIVAAAPSCAGSVTQPISEGDPITLTRTLTTGTVPGGGVWVQTSTVLSQKVVEGGRAKQMTEDPGIDREMTYAVFTLAGDAVIKTSYNAPAQARASARQASALRRLGIENAQLWGARP